MKPKIKDVLERARNSPTYKQESIKDSLADDVYVAMTGVAIDYAKRQSPEYRKVFELIDAAIDSVIEFEDAKVKACLV